MKKTHLIFSIFFTIAAASIAAAYTTPAPTDFAYDIYNVLINKVFHGPIGYAGAVFLIGMGAVRTLVHYDYSVVSFSRTLYYMCWILLGTMILKIDNIMLSLGATI